MVYIDTHKGRPDDHRSSGSQRSTEGAGVRRRRCEASGLHFEWPATPCPARSTPDPYVDYYTPHLGESLYHQEGREEQEEGPDSQGDEPPRGGSTGDLIRWRPTGREEAKEEEGPRVRLGVRKTYYSKKDCPYEHRVDAGELASGRYQNGYFVGLYLCPGCGGTVIEESESEGEDIMSTDGEEDMDSAEDETNEIGSDDFIDHRSTKEILKEAGKALYDVAINRRKR